MELFFLLVILSTPAGMFSTVQRNIQGPQRQNGVVGGCEESVQWASGGTKTKKHGVAFFNKCTPGPKRGWFCVFCNFEYLKSI